MSDDELMTEGDWWERLGEQVGKQLADKELLDPMPCEMPDCQNQTREPTNHPETGVPICPTCATVLAYELGQAHVKSTAAYDAIALGLGVEYEGVALDPRKVTLYRVGRHSNLRDLAIAAAEQAQRQLPSGHDDRLIAALDAYEAVMRGG